MARLGRSQPFPPIIKTMIQYALPSPPVGKIVLVSQQARERIDRQFHGSVLTIPFDLTAQIIPAPVARLVMLSQALAIARLRAEQPVKITRMRKRIVGASVPTIEDIIDFLRFLATDLQPNAQARIDKELRLDDTEHRRNWMKLVTAARRLFEV